MTKSEENYRNLVEQLVAENGCEREYREILGTLLEDGVGGDRAVHEAHDRLIARNLLTKKPQPDRLRVVQSRLPPAGAAKRVNKGGRPRTKATADLFEGKTCSTKEAIEWVAKHIGMTQVKVETCISSEAWGMLKWVQGSPQAENVFWKDLYTRLLPSKVEMDQQETLRDDQRRVLKFVEDSLLEFGEPDADRR
ncbi:MAG: hypothetical protein GY906_38945 [bacterium]|nr:hypothetical protein [bacterium]